MKVKKLFEQNDYQARRFDYKKLKQKLKTTNDPNEIKEIKERLKKYKEYFEKMYYVDVKKQKLTTN